MAVHTGLRTYDDRGLPFEAFVYSIAAHKVADAQRLLIRGPEAVADVPDGVDVTAGPEQLALIRDEASRAMALIRTLPSQQQEILTLRVAVGMSTEETAAALGMTAGAITGRPAPGPDHTAQTDDRPVTKGWRHEADPAELRAGRRPAPRPDRRPPRHRRRAGFDAARGRPQCRHPDPQALVGRRVRRHRGLTVLAALGVAVSGATVAAAVELGPVPPDQASGVPHSRSLLPQGLQDLVMPFLNGTPFQGRFVLPNGSLPTVPTSGSATAAGLPGAVLSTEVGVPVAAATAVQEAQLDRQDQQEAHQKTQAKGTTAGGQGSQSSQAPTGDEQDDQGEQGEQTAAAPEAPKPAEAGARTPAAEPGQHGHGAAGQPGQRRASTGTPTGSSTERPPTAATGDRTRPARRDPPGRPGGTSSTGSVPGDPAGSGAPTKGKRQGQERRHAVPGGGSTKSATGEASTTRPPTAQRRRLSVPAASSPLRRHPGRCPGEVRSVTRRSARAASGPASTPPVDWGDELGFPRPLRAVRRPSRSAGPHLRRRAAAARARPTSSRARSTRRPG